MKKIRSKIIMILLVMVFLPLIPISYMVYQLIDDSYRIGVNPQIRQALEEGITFSRLLYDDGRNTLMNHLEALDESVGKGKPFPAEVRGEWATGLQKDSLFWVYRELAIYDASRKPIWKYTLSGEALPVIDGRILQELEETGKNLLLVSDRKNNLFTALIKREVKDAPVSYLVLRASLKEVYLEKSDHLLQIQQIFQTLDLSRESLVRSFVLAFLAIVGILLVMVFAAGIWISGRITSPISRLVQATEEIGRGNLDFQLPESERKDEISQLMNHFNIMTRQLKENQQRLLYLEKMAAWQQMARKIAHEIKNPLTPIQLTIQQLVDSYRGTDQGYRILLKECAEIIQEEIGSLRNLVTEFSEFGRLPELNLQKGNLNDLIEELSALYGDRLHLDLNQNIPEFFFDSDRFRRVLINLMENAVQADPDHQPIQITTDTESGRIILKVTDQGIGIPPDALPKIFEPYFSTRPGGIGLGLAISRLMVEEHGGIIAVESRPGVGTAFKIELPLENKGQTDQ